MRFLTPLICVVGMLVGPAQAFGRCHYDRIRFYFDGGSASSAGIAESGKACHIRFRGSRLLSIELTQNAQHGSVTIANGDAGFINVTYLSASGYKGPDSFTLTAHGVMRDAGGDYLAAGVQGKSTQTINVDVQ